MPSQGAWPTVLPSHGLPQPAQRPKDPPREADVAPAATNAQMQTMQQTLDQLVQLVSAQRSEQQQLKNEIVQLKSELNNQRLQSANPTPPWATQLETTLAVHFDRQFKKLDEINAPSKTQQVISIIFIQMTIIIDCFKTIDF